MDSEVIYKLIDLILSNPIPDEGVCGKICTLFPLEGLYDHTGKHRYMTLTEPTKRPR